MKKTLIGVLSLAIAAWLFVPAIPPSLPPTSDVEGFVWQQDEVWNSLESEFNAIRTAGCTGTAERVESALIEMTADIEWLEAGGRVPSDVRFRSMEDNLFAVAPVLAACPQQVSVFLEQVNQLRGALKRASQEWDIGDRQARARVYRILYGARMAVEEILLQHQSGDLPELILAADVPSQTPSVVVDGLRIHSGDILVSRGGAPVSALIARGNDYPGNFSHTALVHVSEQQEISIVEAHIEVGVTVATLEQYFADKKRRIMVLRLDDTLQQIKDDPLLPHRAATAALAEARERHVPYDFAMYYQEPSKKFCSEVASAAYADVGVQLWEGLTTMSSSGTRAWLSALGVKQFVTHGPSDLEYDPQLVVVAEWRNQESLFDDHVDNAIIDAMLEGANRGDKIDYEFRYLPLARMAKAYSAALNVVGNAGPVPEGMGATTALRAEWLDKEHVRIKVGVMRQIEAFREDNDYEPPYWQLVDMARHQVVAATET